MIRIFETRPAKVTTRILALVGVAIFAILYTSMLRMFGSAGLEIQKFNQVWTSFDLDVFKQYMIDITEGDHTDTFLTIFKVNVFSMSSFALGLFMLGLLTARRISEASKLRATAFYIPWLAVLVGLLDIVPSLVLLSAASDLVNIADWKIHMIFWGYIIRVIFLYIVLIWMGIVWGNNLVKKMKRDPVP